VQDNGLFCVSGHAIHLCLQLGRSDCPSSLIRNSLRFAKAIFNFPFNLLTRDYYIERGLWPGIIFRPNPMAPVHLLDTMLVCDALRERDRPTKRVMSSLIREGQKALCLQRPRDGANTAHNQDASAKNPHWHLPATLQSLCI
jgi:hypothetical protein